MATNESKSGKQERLREQFVRFIREQQLFDPAERVLLTVSGGLDSVVLAELFRLAGFQYGIAHANFRLRGDESERDAVFVQSLAERHQVPFHTRPLEAQAEVDRTGVSIQMAARRLRYEWFEEVAVSFDYQYIATAHHQDDVLETVLLNLVRGTGLTGLRGIPVRQGRVIRPLWFADRLSIEQYARQHQLSWREDSSNASDYYRRNQLRHQVVPIFKNLNPSLLQTLQTTVERLQSADKLVDQELASSWQALAENRPDGVALPIQPLTQLPEWAFRLSEWLKPYGFQYARMGPIVEAVRSAGFGQVFYSDTHTVVRDRGFLVIESRHPTVLPELVLNELTRSEIKVGTQYVLRIEQLEHTPGFRIPSDPHIGCFDAEQLTWPLRIRPWREGDRFRPLGLKGSQSVGDFLTNRKVSVAERRAAIVLMSNHQIVWLIGYRPDDRFRITDQTRQILKIEQHFVE
ncbi:tRNA lysidine(34) synthetase TilS [Larkinella bovis]|uniref:tRNA(Ile)-lysidine synthase n=1 Tax=Larkinella bovis TaxID=683041 RepID=A0ABW0I9I3_9BACT